MTPPSLLARRGLEHYDYVVVKFCDPFPPGRIADLAVRSYVNGTGAQLYATLEWSAVGSDFRSPDSGPADHYELRCHTDRDFSFHQVWSLSTFEVSRQLFNE